MILEFLIEEITAGDSLRRITVNIGINPEINTRFARLNLNLIIDVMI